MFSITEHWLVPAPARGPRPSRDWLDRWLPPSTLVAVLGGVYGLTLLPGAGYSPDTAEMLFSGPLLCVTHPTGNPAYLLLLHAFSRLVPVGTLAFRANLFSAVCSVLACLVLRRLLLRLGTRDAIATATAVAFALTPTFWRLSIMARSTASTPSSWRWLRMDCSGGGKRTNDEP